MPNSESVDRRPSGRPGLQLYTVRSLMEADVSTTLAAVSEIGYEEVEFASFHDRPAEDIAAMLADNNLTAPACHARFFRYRTDLDAILEESAVVGNVYQVCAWIPPEERQHLDDFRRIAEEFNRWGEVCREAGLQFVFHNHDFEFVEMDGELPFDVILNACDPDLVKIEIDLYWIRKAGFEPEPYFQQNPNRFPLVHLKDMDTSGGMAEVGTGIIDFASDLSYSDQAGMRHYFVEHDDPADPLESVRTSFPGMQALLA